jgi:thymidylate synthase (FAD)
MVQEGVPEEDARNFTFQAGKTRMIVTMNARELRHFFALRTCNRAQWEIRELAKEMMRQCKEISPVLFADAGAGCVRGACPEGTRSCKKGVKNE